MVAGIFMRRTPDVGCGQHRVAQRGGRRDGMIVPVGVRRIGGRVGQQVGGVLRRAVAKEESPFAGHGEGGGAAALAIGHAGDLAQLDIRRRPRRSGAPAPRAGARRAASRPRRAAGPRGRWCRRSGADATRAGPPDRSAQRRMPAARGAREAVGKKPRPGHPARWCGVVAMAGLLARGSGAARLCLPGNPQWHRDGRLSAYSCGGSRGIGVAPAPHSLFTFRPEGTIAA